MKSIITSKLLFVLLLLAPLAGCRQESNLASQLQDYRNKIAIITEGHVSEVDGASDVQSSSWQVDFPSKKDMKVTIPAIEMNLRSFYKINACPLAGLVAQRNTALGKVQLPSQRFLYELELLSTFAECIEQIKDDENELAAQLTNWQGQKKEQFPLVWVSLVQQSSEIHGMLTRSNGYFDMEEIESHAEAIADLAFISSLKALSAAPLRVESMLEQRLQAMSKSRLPATLWRSQAAVIQHLTQVNMTLSQAREVLSCDSEEHMAMIDALSQTYHGYFETQVQPTLQAMQALEEKMNQQLSSWLTMPLSANFADALQYYLQPFQSQVNSAIDTHNTEWNAISGLCKSSG